VQNVRCKRRVDKCRVDAAAVYSARLLRLFMRRIFATPCHKHRHRPRIQQQQQMYCRCSFLTAGRGMLTVTVSSWVRVLACSCLSHWSMHRSAAQTSLQVGALRTHLQPVRIMQLQQCRHSCVMQQLRSSLRLRRLALRAMQFLLQAQQQTQLVVVLACCMQPCRVAVLAPCFCVLCHPKLSRSMLRLPFVPFPVQSTWVVP
jgi:hypothetical protein